jgi:riboflavin synthase
VFTGLIEEMGTVEAIRDDGGALRFSISCPSLVEGMSIDDSVAVEGVCLTVVALRDVGFDTVAVEETLRKTTLGGLRPGSRVNLECALRPMDRLGGHFVQGHVDGVGRVSAWQTQKGGRLLTVELPADLMRYVIPKGSIAIDGVSLTVARLSGNQITISLIPHTLEKTTLGMKRVGDPVNVETDLLGKYVERLLAGSEPGNELTEERLKKLGYGIQYHRRGD